MSECKCKAVVEDLKKEIDRLAEENTNIFTISKDHQKINGDLRVELTQVKEDNKKLAKQIADMQDNYIKIDGKR